MCNIKADKWELRGVTEECHNCQDGINYNLAEKCAACNCVGWVHNGKRRYKCKSCAGWGWIKLTQPEPNGPCKYCAGTRQMPVTLYSSMLPVDREWIWNNLFDLDTPYTGSFNTADEDYLGFNTVCGVTDYGRHLAYSPEKFREEVREFWMREAPQYICLLNKAKKLPRTIQIRRTNSGWFAYPIF